MSTQSIDYLRSIKNLDEHFISYVLIILIFITVITVVIHTIYINRLKQTDCSRMSKLYPSIDGSIKSITPNDPKCKYNLYNYYIKTAYNACSGGSYKNDYINICNLKAVLKQGVRCLDFEIYSVDNKPVVATSTSNSYYVKETFNSVSFADVMTTIKNYAFANGTCPNPNDPIIIHLRIKSNNQKIYTKMAEMFKSYSSLMLGSEYSFENSGKNIAANPLTTFMNKIIIVVDKSNNAFMENKAFMEYVNLTSNSVFMRAYRYFDIKNNPDINELSEFNKRGLTIVFPDKGVSPSNPSGLLCRDLGCQMVAMRYQKDDSFLAENKKFFSDCSYAFCLKPERLRYTEATIESPTPQNPNFSYQTRNLKTDYYSFNY